MRNNQQRNKTALEANAQKANGKTPAFKPFETEFAIETDTQEEKPSEAQKEDQNSWFAGE